MLNGTRNSRRGIQFRGGRNRLRCAIGLNEVTQIRITSKCFGQRLAISAPRSLRFKSSTTEFRLRGRNGMLPEAQFAHDKRLEQRQAIQAQNLLNSLALAVECSASRRGKKSTAPGCISARRLRKRVPNRIIGKQNPVRRDGFVQTLVVLARESLT